MKNSTERMKNSTRYPYTYSCDYIRLAADSASLSRSDASLIRQAIAKAIDMDDELLAEKLANVQLIIEELN